ncbi:hypothetical protein RHSIM_Rhsim11G0011800 [Rhododendron simsii]|uniref:J domain-containing protein n=1 Tax=Rhododendron simsii TaxID=118357 RepID=A0A834L7V0_RHOSS|nr:hypothetical protein RHSIM_Rhsim11G0011800 [Rhododendron simsii]
MVVDYYNILKVSRSTTDEDPKRAYKRLAMKWHPDKNAAAEAEVRFKQISKAYDVLSDLERHRIYNLYGDEALPSSENAASGKCSGSSAVGGDGRRGIVRCRHLREGTLLGWGFHMDMDLDLETFAQKMDRCVHKFEVNWIVIDEMFVLLYHLSAQG